MPVLVVQVMDGTMAFASTQIGTPYYMSPELFKNKVGLPRGAP